MHAIIYAKKMVAYSVLDIFSLYIFSRPKVNVYFQETQSYCKFKGITVKQTFENIFLDIFHVDRWSDEGPLKSIRYSRRIGSSWTESSWRCLTRRRLTSPLRNILWSFLTFLACRIVIMYFHSFPSFLPRNAIPRAYSKYVHTWYTQGVHYWLNNALP